MTVILLKNEGENDPYRALGNVEFLPVMHHSFVDTQGLNEYLVSPEFEQVDSVIITSQRAVEALASLTSELSEVERITLQSKPTFTVGPATAALLKYHGFTDVRGEETGNGNALSEILQNESFKSYIFFTGETRRDAIPDTLNAKQGVTLAERVVYSTVGIPTADEQFANLFSQYNSPIVVFFSPSHADGIAQHLQNYDRSQFKLAAIGPTTQEYLQGFNLTPDAVAEKPDPEHLQHALSNIT